MKDKIRELRKSTGLSQHKFGDKYNIPLRTMQNWESGVSTPPEYVYLLLARCVREDFTEEKEQIKNKWDNRT